MAWLDRLPYGLLIFAALMLGLAPFIPEPHLLQKMKMLLAGELTRPEDIGDVLFHGAPLILIAFKLKRDYFSSTEA
ncbi:MAG: hypothetical protein R2834_13895 [Rhodothermales bacterium]